MSSATSVGNGQIRILRGYDPTAWDPNKVMSLSDSLHVVILDSDESEYVELLILSRAIDCAMQLFLYQRR